MNNEITTTTKQNHDTIIIMTIDTIITTIDTVIMTITLHYLQHIQLVRLPIPTITLHNKFLDRP